MGPLSQYETMEQTEDLPNYHTKGRYNHRTHGAVAVATNNGSLVNDARKNKHYKVFTAYIASMISEKDIWYHAFT